jgi:hypothetical protein
VASVTEEVKVAGKRSRRKERKGEEKKGKEGKGKRKKEEGGGGGGSPREADEGGGGGGAPALEAAAQGVVGAAEEKNFQGRPPFLPQPLELPVLLHGLLQAAPDLWEVDESRLGMLPLVDSNLQGETTAVESNRRMEGKKKKIAISKPSTVIWKRQDQTNDEMR